MVSQTLMQFFFGIMVFRAETFEKKSGQSDMSSWFRQINHEMLVIRGNLELHYFLRWLRTKLGFKCAKFRYSFSRYFNCVTKSEPWFKANSFMRKSFNRSLDKWYFTPKTWYFFRAVAEEIINKVLFIDIDMLLTF